MNILILGANSDIAIHLATRFAESARADLCLASMDTALLQKKARDIEIRYSVRTDVKPFNALDFNSHNQFYKQLEPKPDGVIISFGYLGDQQKAQNDFNEAARIMQTNYMGAVSILEIIAQDFERRGHGFIIGVSSVAGERGRRGNYIYGSAKSALTVYLSGLRNRLSQKKISVITVLPGFVRTKMTRGMNLPESLTAEPESVADDIYNAWINKKEIIYSKSIWRVIMFFIKIIPEKIFKYLNI